MGTNYEVLGLFFALQVKGFHAERSQQTYDKRIFQSLLHTLGNLLILKGFTGKSINTIIREFLLISWSVRPD